MLDYIYIDDHVCVYVYVIVIKLKTITIFKLHKQHYSSRDKNSRGSIMHRFQTTMPNTRFKYQQNEVYSSNINNMSINTKNNYGHEIKAMREQEYNRPIDNYWDDQYNRAQQQYVKLVQRYKTTKQSRQLYQQSLSLKNKQLQQIENRIYVSNKKITQYNHQKLSKYQEILKKYAYICHAIKNQIQTTRLKLRKEESIIVEEQKHYDEINGKIMRLEKDTAALLKEHKYKLSQEEKCEELFDENAELMDKFKELKKQLSFVEIREEKSLQDQEKLGKKVNQLKRIAQIRQNKNKQLRRHLLNLKKSGNPKNRQSTKNQENFMSLEEMDRNINHIQAQYGNLQQQIYNLNEKIHETTHKMAEKSHSIKLMQEKRKEYNSLADEQQSPQKIGTAKKNALNFNKNPSSPDQRAKNSHLQQKNQQQVSMKAYRVIQSQGDEYSAAYPKFDNINTQSNHENYHENDSSIYHLESNRESNHQREQSGTILFKNKQLKMTNSLENIISRYSKIAKKS